MSFSTYIVPSIIVIIIFIGVIQKKEVYSVFCSGAVEGIRTVKNMFPILIAVFMAITMLRSSGLIEFLATKINFLTTSLNIPAELLPLMIIKPISGSASMAVASDLIKTYGTESRIGMLAGTIMSSSETTFYVIAIYLSTLKIKGNKKVIIPALIADITAMIVALWVIK